MVTASPSSGHHRPGQRAAKRPPAPPGRSASNSCSSLASSTGPSWPRRPMARPSSRRPISAGRPASPLGVKRNPPAVPAAPGHRRRRRVGHRLERARRPARRGRRAAPAAPSIGPRAPAPPRPRAAAAGRSANRHCWGPQLQARPRAASVAISRALASASSGRWRRIAPRASRGRMAARPASPEPAARRSSTVSAWSSRVWAVATSRGAEPGGGARPGGRSGPLSPPPSGRLCGFSPCQARVRWGTPRPAASLGHRLGLGGGLAGAGRGRW